VRCQRNVLRGWFMSEPVSEKNESFYAAAVTRIPRFMALLAIVFTVTAWVRFGWRVALGFACGCAIAYLNFHWLERVVTVLADRVTRTGQAQSSGGVVLRFLLRYLLMALGGYAIFSVSPASLYGLFAGLFLPVAGIACEAVYEVYAAYARGI
jgi:ATP synthase I chain